MAIPANNNNDVQITTGTITVTELAAMLRIDADTLLQRIAKMAVIRHEVQEKYYERFCEYPER